MCQLKQKLYTFLVQHKQHMKEYRQKHAKTKEKSDICTEEDLTKRLDELELEEELEDEIYRLSVNEVLLLYKTSIFLLFVICIILQIGSSTKKILW